LSGTSPALGDFSELDVIQEICRRCNVNWLLVDVAPLQPQALLGSLEFARDWMRKRFKPD